MAFPVHYQRLFKFELFIDIVGGVGSSISEEQEGEELVNSRLLLCFVISTAAPLSGAREKSLQSLLNRTAQGISHSASLHSK